MILTNFMGIKVLKCFEDNFGVLNSKMLSDFVYVASF